MWQLLQLNELKTIYTDKNVLVMVNDAVKLSAVVKTGLALDIEGQILHDSTSERCLE